MKHNNSRFCSDMSTSCTILIHNNRRIIVYYVIVLLCIKRPIIWLNVRFANMINKFRLANSALQIMSMKEKFINIVDYIYLSSYYLTNTNSYDGRVQNAEIICSRYHGTYGKNTTGFLKLFDHVNLILLL